MVDGKPLSHTASMIGARHGDTVQPGQDNLLTDHGRPRQCPRDIALTAGKHRIEVSMSSDTSHAPVQIRLAWMTPETRETNFGSGGCGLAREKGGGIRLGTAEACLRNPW